MPASKLPKESEKKKMSVQSMVKKKKFCASRLFHAPKVQRESVKKKHCAIAGCRDGPDKKKIQRVLFLSVLQDRSALCLFLLRFLSLLSFACCVFAHFLL